MDMSDRGMFDIERFDLDPNYPTLHGLLNEELTYEFLASLKTSEDKLPYMLPMVGIDTLSPKMKASILEVASSITTWPQLGSDVIMGGAVSANVARRILLGDRLKSGRSWVDIDKLFQVEGENQVTINTEVDSDIYSSEYNSANSILSDDEIASLLKAASLAPSPGNLQRWMWSFRNDEIHLTNTHHSNVKLGDHGNVGSNLSYGAALENLILTAKSLGYDFQLKLFPSEIAEVVAVVKLNKANVQADDLSAYIHTRQTHRLDGEEEFDLDKLDQLRDLIARSNSEELFIQLLDQETDVSKIASLIGRGDRLRLMNELGYREFFKEEIRWNKEEAETIGDGLDISLFDFTPSDLIGLKLANDESAMAFLREIGGGKGFEKISPKSFKKHHKIIVFSVRDYSNSAIVKAGMQIQRFWLNCSGLQLGIHPYTVMQMLFSHLYIGSDILSKSEKKELQAIHDSFHDVIGMNPNEYKSVFLAKVICNPAPQRRSYRKPINKIFK
jgi:hypothetical protein